MCAHEAGQQRLTFQAPRRVESERADDFDAATLDHHLHAALQFTAGPGEIGFDDLPGHAQNLAISSRRMPPARWNSSFGVNSFGRCATSIAPGPKTRHSIPSDCSQPASLAKET